MDALTSMNSGLAGFFASAAIQSAIFWWLSRKERVLLVFSVQCAVYAVFSMLLTSYFRATTIPGMQAASGRNVSLGMIAHALVLQFYGELGNRRDRAFRALLTGVLCFLALLNLWAPVRGTIVDITAMQLPGGATGWAPVRTAPGASLVLMYLAEATVQVYGFFVARVIWKRDRIGTFLVAVGAAASLGGVLFAVLIDFASLRAPYLGASPHAVFVVCVALFLAREYSARGAELRAHRERLEELAGRLIEAHEQERKRIARELHDDLAQRLAGIGITLSSLKRQLPDAEVAGKERVSALQQEVIGVGEWIRLLSHQLHSSILQHAGLEVALEQYCKDFTERQDVAVSLAIQEGLGPVPPDVALCLYRVVQESLQNVAKHSGSTRARIGLAARNEVLELTITDEGAGFEPTLAASVHGLGLRSMEERVHLLHGTFQVATRPNAGTEVRVRIPWTQA